MLDCCRVFLSSDGEYYTSPNCTTLPDVPPYFPEQTMALKPGDLRQRRWLSNQFPFFAFALHDIQLRGPLFSRLNVTYLSVPILEGQLGYSMDPIVQQSWHRLEYGLTQVAFSLLHNTVGAKNGDFNYLYLPQECGYLQPHREERFARSCAMKAKDAMVQLANLCSFAIATYENADAAQKPNANWIRVMIRNGAHPNWLGLLQESFVCDFSPGIRKGAFVNPTATSWGEILPNLVKAGVPLWFWWGNTPGSGNCDRLHPNLRALLPNDADLLKTNVPQPFLPAPCHDSSYLDIQFEDFPIAHLDEYVPPIASPSGSNLPPSTMLPAFPPLPNGSRQLPNETLHAFLTRMTDLSASRRQKETATSTQSRVSRERYAESCVRPSKKSQVFEWNQVDGFLIRERVNRVDVEDVWDDYAPSQHHYNSVLDEWDLCVELDPSAKPSDDGDMYLDESEQEFEVHAGHIETLYSNLQDDPNMWRVDLENVYKGVDIISTTLVLPNCLSIMRERFGFIFPSQPLTDTSDYSMYIRKTSPFYVTADVKAWNGFGHNHAVPQVRRAKDQIASAPHTLIPLNLYNIIATTQASPMLPVQLSDLMPGNPVHIGSFTRYIERYLSDQDSSVCIYLIYSDPSVSLWDRRWTLAVDSASSALQAHRHCIHFGDGIPKICHRFLELGIHFNTVAPSSQNVIPKPVEIASEWALGWRPAKYTPDVNDYKRYEDVRDEFLRGPFGRAALLHGGIIWRLAREIVSDDEVLEGPSRDFQLYGGVVMSYGMVNLVDDALSGSALDVISGLYKVDTGNC